MAEPISKTESILSHLHWSESANRKRKDTHVFTSWRIEKYQKNGKRKNSKKAGKQYNDTNESANKLAESKIRLKFSKLLSSL